MRAVRAKMQDVSEAMASRSTTMHTRRQLKRTLSKGELVELAGRRRARTHVADLVLGHCRAVGAVVERGCNP